MSLLTEKRIKELSMALTGIQQRTIGIASIAGQKGMIVNYDGEDSYMQVITLLSLGGISNEHVAVDSEYVNYAYIFPDSKNLTDMLNDPIAFNDWCKSNNIK